jgi:DNA-directed RNA polymerase specialized sigma24 family protein
MATSKVAVGKLRVAMAKGESLPEGYALDGHGQPTRDPDGEASRPEKPEHVWLRQQLLRLDPAARALLEGRVLESCSWPELARRSGVSQATARRRVQVLLRQLRQAAQAWRGAEPGAMPWLQAS